MLFTKTGIFALLAVSVAAAADFKAGLARVAITPKEPIRMAGYAVRTKPSEGVVHDLWAKALALEDERRGRVVIVTLDSLTVVPEMASEVAAKVKQQHGLSRERLVFNASHTHAGPMVPWNRHVRPDDEQEGKVVDRYARQLTGALVEVIGAALRDLAPAELAVAHGRAEFGRNRRRPSPSGVQLAPNPEGPSDPDVPVLVVRDPAGRIRGMLFGYACHNTTLTGGFMRMAGDYAGFAQIELEKAHPGATALFIALCGGDQNPQPRETLELAEQHGRTLAAAVSSAIAAGMKPVRGPLRAALVTTELRFAPHTRDTFARRLDEKNEWRVRHARYMLAAYDSGKPVRSLSYPVQAVRFGRDLTMMFLGGEVVVGYALRAKEEFRGEDLIVAGYSNDVRCYIPTLRVLKEGGYEPDGSMIYYGMPGPFDEDVEERVFAAMRRALGKVGRDVPRQPGR